MNTASDLSLARETPWTEEQLVARTSDDVSQTVDCVTTLSEFLALEADWHALEAASPAFTAFQSFAQLGLWCRHQLEQNRLLILVGRQEGRPVMIWPLAAGRGAVSRYVITVARMAGDPISQYSDILADPQADPAIFGDLMVAARKNGVDAVELTRVRADSNLMRFAAPLLGEAEASAVAPFADLTPFADYQSYLDSLSRNVRKNLRNRRNNLGKAGEVAFELHEGGPEARATIARALELKRDWLIQRGAVSTAFMDPNTRACLLDVAADHAGVGSVVVTLKINGEPAAIRFGFEHRGTYYAYLSAYDQRFSHLSPGTMLFDFYMAQFRERGIGRIDMLAPAGRHKSDWCTQEMPVGTYTLPLTMAGGLYAGFYRRRLRPTLKSTWLAMPEGVRSRLASRVLAT